MSNDATPARAGYPDIVQYRCGDALLDLPPTPDSHPEQPEPGRRAEGKRSQPWKPVIHDREAYDRLWLAGTLWGARS